MAHSGQLGGQPRLPSRLTGGPHAAGREPTGAQEKAATQSATYTPGTSTDTWPIPSRKTEPTKALGVLDLEKIRRAADILAQSTGFVRCASNSFSYADREGNGDSDSHEEGADSGASDVEGGGAYGSPTARRVPRACTDVDGLLAGSTAVSLNGSGAVHAVGTADSRGEEGKRTPRVLRSPLLARTVARSSATGDPRPQRTAMKEMYTENERNGVVQGDVGGERGDNGNGDSDNGDHSDEYSDCKEESSSDSEMFEDTQLSPGLERSPPPAYGLGGLAAVHQTDPKPQTPLQALNLTDAEIEVLSDALCLDYTRDDVAAAAAKKSEESTAVENIADLPLLAAIPFHWNIQPSYERSYSTPFVYAFYDTHYGPAEGPEAAENANGNANDKTKNDSGAVGTNGEPRLPPVDRQSGRSTGVRISTTPAGSLSEKAKAFAAMRGASKKAQTPPTQPQVDASDAPVTATAAPKQEPPSGTVAAPLPAPPARAHQAPKARCAATKQSSPLRFAVDES